MCRPPIVYNPKTKANTTPRWNDVSQIPIHQYLYQGSTYVIRGDTHKSQTFAHIVGESVSDSFKALNDIAPPYICDLVKVYLPKKDLRSQNEYRLDPPKTRLKTYGDRGFEAAAAKEWNKLPLDIKFAPSLTSFKSKLKTYLFRIHFNLNCDNET